jgi:hypothetical protein
MKNYAVFIEGNNFTLVKGGTAKVVGFFVTKRVEASTEAEAESMATAAVMSDPLFQHVEQGSAHPEVVVKVVHELPWSNKMKDTDYVFQ